MKYVISFGLVATLALTGCGTQTQQQAPSLPFVRSQAPKLELRPTKLSPIQYVLLIIQENRTPDNLFQGLAGADIANFGYNSQGQKVPLHSVPLEAPYDMSHKHASFLTEYDGGKMDGFDLDFSSVYCPDDATCAYGYVPQAETQPYLDMASQYAFADRMFQSNQGPSFPAHQYLISGTSTTVANGQYKAADNPYVDNHADGGGCDAPAEALVATIDPQGNPGNPVYPCFDRPTLADSLDNQGFSWRYYQMKAGPGLWHAYDAIQHIRFGKDNSDIVYPSDTILGEINLGVLKNVSWVTPSGADSDHAGNGGKGGPAWVASIVNAVGNSQYWNNCAIFIVWDDWGGWYDHVPPPIYNSYELGMRVPLVVVSPYAKPGYVSHTQYEFGSILKFIEETFGLASLGTTDVRANSVSDMFDFKKRPRAFVRIRAPRWHPNYSMPDSD
jgi:phospholipase C